MALVRTSSTLFLIVLLLNPNSTIGTSKAKQLPRVNSIYQFGDSISDTGNHKTEGITVNQGFPLWFCSDPPYGETLSPNPTGRCSDGLLILDFFAKALDLPPVEPYLHKDADFTHGVNFAVAGATTLDASTYSTLAVTPFSLNAQLEWFRNHVKSICSSPSDCKKKFESALFIMGEFGATDYQQTVIDRYVDYEDFVHQTAISVSPKIVETIVNAVKEVINHGAVQVIVPGNFPLGCMPFFRNNLLLHTVDPAMYDDLGCVKPLNELTRYHNQLLQQALKDLEIQYPGVSIHYGDYYSAFMSLISNAASLGFDNDQVIKPCIVHHQYGDGPTEYCLDPTKKIFWDDVHLTQEAYKYMAGWLLSHIYPQTSLPSPSPTPETSGSNQRSQWSFFKESWL